MSRHPAFGGNMCRTSVNLISPPIQKVALSIAEAAAASSLSRAYLYCAMNEGRLRYLKMGTRRLILADDLRSFLEGEVKCG